MAAERVRYIGIYPESSETFIWRETTKDDEEPVREELRIYCQMGDDRHCDRLPTWGYGGHGPHDTAYSLLADVLPSEDHSAERRGERKTIAATLCHDFVANVVARWPFHEGRPGEQWSISRDEIVRWCQHAGVPEAGTDFAWTGSAYFVDRAVLAHCWIEHYVWNATYAGRKDWQVTFTQGWTSDDNRLRVRHNDSDGWVYVNLNEGYVDPEDAQREAVGIILHFDEFAQAQGVEVAE